MDGLNMSGYDISIFARITSLECDLSTPPGEGSKSRARQASPNLALFACLHKHHAFVTRIKGAALYLASYSSYAR